jgi:hypothetical protein
VSKTHVHRSVPPKTSTPKKSYKTPRLIEYGHISKLTAGTTGTHTDKGTLANMHGGG